ncbi:MAG: TAXI family TRAP transporter solute-binding subunit [Syntrophorhabdaceae bacterium]|nr:TAXI family TRAP transporter solute-binding subunit [Syntrophorhabdaceae bacterium]MDD5242541.1 TAXI family TRAP transporter solute-binding subunit [Syntrophorhabdaceae bacterium]
MKRERNKEVTVFAAALAVALVCVMICGVQTSAVASPEKKVTLTLMSAKFGSSDYILGSAVEKIVNKLNHPWLKIMTVEGIGGTDNIVTYDKLSLEKKRRTIMNVGDAGYYAAVLGMKPWFTKKYKNLRAVCSFGTGEMFFATMNPSIKSIYDLEGKTLGGPDMGSSASVRLREFLKAADMTGKINIKWLGFSKAAEALQDRRVDAIIVVSFSKRVAPGFTSLWTKQDKIYVFGMPADLFPKVHAAGWPFRAVTIKPLTYTPNQTTEITVHQMLARTYFTGVEADADTIYEFVKLMYQNVDKFKQYLPAGTSPTRDELSNLPVDSEAEVHPGALRFFKEMKVKIGAP